MRKPCTILLSGISGACTIIPVRPERSGAKSKGALLVLATVLMVAALAGCGGGKTAALPAGMDIEGLPPGSMLQEPRTLGPGDTLTVRVADGMRTEITCPKDGEACLLTPGEDGAIRYTGGTPTVVTVPYTPIQLPEGELMLPEGATMFTLAAGESLTLQQTFDTRTELRCPEGGEACVVTLTEGGGAESTGGAPTVTTYATLYLPSGTTLTEGTIPAGVRRSIGYSLGRTYDIVCPADGEDCEVTLGEFDFESTGGTPYVATRDNRMVWQANNGPDGKSNGAHARGFRGMLQAGANFGTVVTFGGGRLSDRYHTQTQPAGTTARTVTPTASWADTAAAPTLALDLTGTGTGSYSVVGDSEIPSLAGWNGVALRKTLTSPARTGYAVLYSDITQQPDGGSADGSYLTFGAWMDIPDDPAAASANFLFGAFTAGPLGRRVGLTPNGRREMSGVHSYAGVATGVYSKATYTGMGSSRALESTRVGSFTATATLSANFAGNGNFLGVGGSISNFRENGESLGAWHIGLQNASSASSGSPEYIQGSFIGSGPGRSAIGPELADYLAGDWTAIFYRGDGESGTNTPNYVTGTFRANTGAENNDSLIMLGAYAATRRP